VTGARKDDDDDAPQSRGDQAADPSAWALPADAAVTAAGGGGVSEPASSAAAAGADGTTSGTGIPPLDKAIAALPVDDQVIEQHPEYLVGGAFVAGFLLAKLLKAIGN
jgi:hypothetical protein